MLDYTPCKCGRTHVRMKKPAGRTDDMLIIRGVNVFPSQIEEVLLKYGDVVSPNYQIIVGRERNVDTFDINVERQVGYTGDAESVEKKLITKLRSQLGIGAKVHLVDVNSITRSEGKAKRVIDYYACL